MASTGSEKRRRAWYALLALPLVALLWPPFYARAEPALFGMPFFYWYQFLWCILTPLIIGVVYFATRTRPEDLPERQRS